jgi:methionyl-tRNA formyltransferase
MKNNDNKLKILFCSPRHWGLELYFNIVSKFSNHDFYFAKNPEGFDVLAKENNFDLLILAGWSWILPKDIVNNITCVGIHPSDLPYYSGGSPIQHQIVDGLEKTKVSLFKLEEKLDRGKICYKCDFDLSGNITDILSRLSDCSFELISQFLDDYPNVVFSDQEESSEKNRKRFTPEDGKMSLNIGDKTVKDVYNMIRCRGGIGLNSFYPPAYIEDDTGRLYFKLVDFEELKK